MRKQALLCALLFVSYEYYHFKLKIESIPSVSEPAEFHPPFIQHVVTPKDYQYIHHDYMEMGNSIFLGLYDWCDTLRIPDAVVNYDRKPAKRQCEFLWKGKNTDFKTDGFRLVPDYSSTIVFNYWSRDVDWRCQKWAYYPVYLINLAAEPRYFILLDDYVFALQEAEDPYAVQPDIFWPIEYNRKDYAIVGKSAIKVEPDEFVMFIVPRYTGGTKTKLRVRIKNGDNIIASDAFLGEINYDQFYAEPDSPIDLLIDKIQFKYTQFIPYMFLGAMPKATQYDRS